MKPVLKIVTLLLALLLMLSACADGPVDTTQETWVTNTLLSATCLVFCSVLALLGHISVGEVVLYQSLFSSISGHVSSLIGIFPQLSTGMESLYSVSEIMNAQDVEINVGKKNIPDIDGNVEFKDVYYKYPDSSDYDRTNSDDRRGIFRDRVIRPLLE